MGGMKVNDRAVSLLEQYDLEVLRTRKGRGAILCEPENGLYILKEYEGSLEKLNFQNELLKGLKEKGLDNVEQIVPNKEGNLVVTDFDQTVYFLKTYFEGRECNINDENDLSNLINYGRNSCFRTNHLMLEYLNQIVYSYKEYFRCNP